MSNTYSIYSIIALANNEDSLREAITSSFEPGEYFELSNAAGWLVTYPGTTKELSDHIKLTGDKEQPDKPVGATLITSIHTYYGRGSSDMWEWLKTRMERAS